MNTIQQTVSAPLLSAPLLSAPLLSAPIEKILVSGGDTRLAIDAQNGLNSYGCTPVPRPQAFSFGSSTASSISNRAFCTVETRRQEILRRFHPGGSHEDAGSHNDAGKELRDAGTDLLDEQTERQRNELTHLLGLGEKEVEVVFSPSGTDSTLHALFLARALRKTPALDSIVLASDETGSGVPYALSGRHFNTITAEGIAVIKGDPIAGLSADLALISLPIREESGALRTPARMDQEVIAAVSRSVAAGRSVLLQVMDRSKCGVRCPSMDCLKRIQSRFADTVYILVDACQTRISLARLKWHLDQGHMVLISGSKFFSGPPFSGALLVPASLAACVANIGPVPPGLQDYTNRCAWPKAWRHIRESLPDRANFGPYFRWAAALEEMRAYFSVPLAFRRLVLQQLAEFTTRLLDSRSPHLLAMPGWESSSEDIDDAEMAVRTIFPFVLRHGNEWMSFADSTKLYWALNQDIAERLPVDLSPQEKTLASQICHIGQPVSVSVGGTRDRGALRLCISARTVSAIWSRHRRDAPALPLERERYEIRTILDKSELILRCFAPFADSVSPRC